MATFDFLREQTPLTRHLWRLTLPPEVGTPISVIKMTAKGCTLDYLDGLGFLFSYDFESPVRRGGNHPLGKTRVIFFRTKTDIHRNKFQLDLHDARSYYCFHWLSFKLGYTTALNDRFIFQVVYAIHSVGTLSEWPTYAHYQCGDVWKS